MLLDKKAGLDDLMESFIYFFAVIGGLFGFYMVNSSYGFVKINFVIPDSIKSILNIALGFFFALWIGLLTLIKADQMNP